jgi:AcrR family transcriptional regulator
VVADEAITNSNLENRVVRNFGRSKIRPVSYTIRTNNPVFRLTLGQILKFDEQYVRAYWTAVGKRSLREDILNAGLKVMFRLGYQGATVRDICTAAGAPHGSFTNHFSSKEAFAREVLDRYFENTKRYVEEALDEKSLTPRQRLKRYLDIITSVLADAKWNRGCLIGDFSLETSQSKLLRQRLDAIFRESRPICLVHRRGTSRR